jgi:hypothetical protein
MVCRHSPGMRFTAFAVTAFLSCAAEAVAQPPSLGAADSFVILAGTRVVNTGATDVIGSVGVTAPTEGKPVVPLLGDFFSNDVVVTRAQKANVALYNNLSSRPCKDLPEVSSELPLPPGTYCLPADAKLPDPLTLKGTADDLWIIQVTGDLTIDAGASMLLRGGAQSSHVFWTVSGSATLGPNSAVAGNLLVHDNITFGRTVTLAGRALAQHGAVTLDTDAVNLCGKLLLFSPKSPLPNGRVGEKYPNTTIEVSEGDPPYTLDFVNGPLLSGTPTQEGTFEYLVKAKDDRGARAVHLYTITVKPAFPPIVPPPPLPPGFVCDRYRADFLPSGGSGKFKVEVTGLPPDLHGTTKITGIPAKAGSFPIDVTITDLESGIPP